jgi:hypothetical protein
LLHRKAKDRKALFLGLMQIEKGLIIVISLTNTGRGYFSSQKFADLRRYLCLADFSDIPPLPKKKQHMTFLYTS